ncbi:MAG: ATP synthase F1 subunit delta [Acidobacteriales bacterium]|nr:ATP synthase F1 subunit delta [Terriglobales bacterium]
MASSVTTTYARAFADVVFGAGLDATQTLREAKSISEFVLGSKELREVWEAPSITAEQKRAVLDAIVARAKISKPVRNFIAVLIDHRRIQFLEAIVTEFGHELNRRSGFVEAEITSARELGPKERQSLEDQVGQITGSKVRARYSEDESLLGGAVVRVGSTVYDGSIQGQLERLRETISTQF